MAIYVSYFYGNKGEADWGYGCAVVPGGLPTDASDVRKLMDYLERKNANGKKVVPFWWQHLPGDVT